MSSHGRRRQRRARAELLARFTPGDPCARCGRPMWSVDDDLHADHFEAPLSLDPDAEPDALAHARCNVYAGRVWQLLMGGHTPRPHVDDQLELVRRQVMSQAEGLDLGRAVALAGRGPVIRSSRDW